jgi:hypothetical protein
MQVLDHNQMKNLRKQKILLENGLDFVVENKTLETNFYKQLIISCENLNDNAKKQLYSNKLKQSK